MSNIESLKQRIEQAELRLKTAHFTRQRESAALLSMWDEIRRRFSAQSAEIVRLRERVASLEDTRDRLLSMVRTLLASVESSVERMADETVPRITSMAEELLESASETFGAQSPHPTPEASAGLASDDRTEHNAGTDQSAAESPEGAGGFAALLSEQLERDDIALPPPPSAGGSEAGEPVSPGIRNLINRIETAFERKTTPADDRRSPTDGPPADEDLARDLDDIRRLRAELQSLRTRIGAAG